MKISLVTTCMGRVHHLKETLPQNMAGNRPRNGTDVEFVVLDYNSPDGLEEWIKTDPQMVDAMQSGFLRYGKNDDVTRFHMSHAKNQAVRLATGDVVCNVDADNFTGSHFAQYLDHIFTDHPDTVLNPSRRLKHAVGGGIWGRVAMTHSNFSILGGYDEKFSGWGGEEVDLVRRAKGLGLTNYFLNDEYRAGVIRHSNEERVVNMVSSKADFDKEVAKIEKISGGCSTWQKVSGIFSVMARQVQVNNGGEFGMGRVRLGLEETPLEFGPLAVPKFSRAHINALHLPEFVIERVWPQHRMVQSVDPQEGLVALPHFFTHHHG